MVPSAQRKIDVDAVGSVSGLWSKARDAVACFVFAHGTGAGMSHPFMEAVATGLSERNIATLRYQFPYTDRAQHLSDIHVPMLFLQGDRDGLADVSLLRQVVKGLGERASLHDIAHADHSFHVPVRSGTTDQAAMSTMLDICASWIGRLVVI
jgi:predicted alpha/beta-hydrolase family hydrolase